MKYSSVKIVSSVSSYTGNKVTITIQCFESPDSEVFLSEAKNLNPDLDSGVFWIWYPDPAKILNPDSDLGFLLDPYSVFGSVQKSESGAGQNS